MTKTRIYEYITLLNQYKSKGLNPLNVVMDAAMDGYGYNLLDERDISVVRDLLKNIVDEEIPSECKFIKEIIIGAFELSLGNGCWNIDLVINELNRVTKNIDRLSIKEEYSYVSVDDIFGLFEIISYSEFKDKLMDLIQSRKNSFMEMMIDLADGYRYAQSKSILNYRYRLEFNKYKEFIKDKGIDKIDLDELITEESVKYIENNEHYSQAIALLYEISINKISCNTKRIVANSYVFGKNTELMKGIILVATKKDCLELFSYMVENSVGEKAYWVSEEKIKEYMIDFYKDVDCMSEVRFPKELALKKENIYQIKKNIVMINYYENYMTI